MGDNYSTTLERLKPDNRLRLFSLNQEIVQSGEIVIDKDKDLGINDPLTHLFLYIKNGEQAVLIMQQDVETDVAERLPKTPFVNNVDFKFEDGDFLSVKDRVSMRKMSAANLGILEIEVGKNPSLQQEYDRAKIEEQEVDKLASWFNEAPINSFMIFESLPIGSQEIAMSRIYKKVSGDQIEGSFVTLYNPSIAMFNKLRIKLEVSDHDYRQDELDLLANNYSFYSPEVESSSDFIDYYVGAYDSVLKDSYRMNTKFGLEYGMDVDKQNGIEKVRQHPKLTSIYIEAVKSLSDGKGLVTPEIVTICKRLHIDNNLSVGSKITTNGARELLKNVIVGISGVIDRADSELLNELARYDADSSVFYDTVSFYSEEASRSSDNYAGICSEVSRTDSETNGPGDDSEYNSLYLAFNVREKLDNFGKPKIGVCIIPGCASHGKSGVFHEKTLVGGCNICVGCHMILQKGGSPADIYAKEKEATEKRTQSETIAKKTALTKILGKKEIERNIALTKQNHTAKQNMPIDWNLKRIIDRDNDEINGLKKAIKKVS